MHDGKCAAVTTPDLPVYRTLAMHSILYQRGVYPQETFDVAKKYGCNLWLNNDEGLTKYLQTVLHQTKGGMHEIRSAKCVS